MSASRCITDATGHWFDILTGPGGVDPALLDGKPRACPICGEGTDRFTFDNKDGRGTWICRQCPARPGKGAAAGDGVDLLRAVTGWDFRRAVAEVERFLGLPPQGGSNGHRQASAPAAPIRRQASPPAPPAALPAVPQGPIHLLHLPEAATDLARINPSGPVVPLKEGDYILEAVYRYSPTQEAHRLMPVAGGRKRFSFRHREGGTWVYLQGSDPWPLWRQAEALAAAEANPGGWVLETEGEKAAELARAGGLVAVTQPGNAHRPEDIAPRYRRLQAGGVAGVVYLADHDDEGLKRLQQALDAAAAAGLPLVVLPAYAVWPCVPAGGSIDDARGTPAERVAAIEQTIGLIKPGEWAEVLSEFRQAMGVDAPTQQVVAGAIKEAGDPERPPAGYRELLAQALEAVRRGDVDAEMTVRAEIMGRFKRKDAQITAALFKDLTKAEGGGITQAAYREVDLDQLDPMEWLLEGFIPANDITLLYGEGGAGKTTATLAMAFALINGTGFLDRESPAPRSRVLFIASDSGGTPLKTALHTLGLADHPALAAGNARRFHVWAHDAGQGAMAWDASLAGCLALLEAVRTQGFDLVVIDSCKAVTAKADDLSYTDNGQVTALLTFIKEVICRHCAVVLINHDGTAKGATAGAKSWKEIPSMVHSIELVQGADPKGKVQADDPRSWVVKKSRFPGVTREFRYSLDQETGQLQLDHMAEKVKDCRDAITEVLTQAWQEGTSSLSRRVIVERCWELWRYSRKSVDNSLSWMAGSKHPEVVRVPSLRGHYRLSPRMTQTLSP